MVFLFTYEKWIIKCGSIKADNFVLILLHGKNDFAEVSKSSGRSENNFVRPSK